MSPCQNKTLPNFVNMCAEMDENFSVTTSLFMTLLSYFFHTNFFFNLVHCPQPFEALMKFRLEPSEHAFDL